MFKRVLPHAKRIMDNKEFTEINKLFEEFQAAVQGSIDPTMPEEERIEIVKPVQK